MYMTILDVRNKISQMADNKEALIKCEECIYMFREKSRELPYPYEGDMVVYRVFYESLSKGLTLEDTVYYITGMIRYSFNVTKYYATIGIYHPFNLRLLPIK